MARSRVRRASESAVAAQRKPGVDAAARAGFLAALGEVGTSSDQTDGLRLALTSGRYLHLRPSGNAPELRFHAEAETAQAAVTLLAAGLGQVAKALRLLPALTPPENGVPGRVRA